MNPTIIPAKADVSTTTPAIAPKPSVVPAPAPVKPAPVVAKAPVAPVAPATVAPKAPVASTSTAPIAADALKQAIQWAAQNPTTPQAKELQSRITSGKYNDTITAMGFKPEQFGYKEPAPAPMQEGDTGTYTVKTIFGPETHKSKMVNGVEVNEFGLPVNSKFKDSIAYKVGDALTRSEQAFGQDIAAAASTVLPESWTGIKAMKEAADQYAQNQVNDLKLLKIQKEQGNEKGAAITLAAIKRAQDNPPPGYEDLYPSLNKTTLQVLGDAGGVLLDVAAAGSLKGAGSFKLAPRLTQTAEEAYKAKQAFNAMTLAGKIGSISKEAAKAAAVGAGIGYGYDVTSKAQQNVLDLKPGAGAAIGAAVPLVIGGVRIAGAIAKDQAPRIINSLIGTKKNSFSYGKNPGRAIAEEGITANSLPDLEDKVGEAKNKWGQNIKSINSDLTLKGANVGSLDDALAPLDKAMDDAAAKNNQALLTRLQNTKESLTKYLVRDADLTPEFVDNFIKNSTLQLRQGAGNEELAKAISSIDVNDVKTLGQLKDAVVKVAGEDALKDVSVSRWLKTTATEIAELHPDKLKPSIIAIADRNLTNPAFDEAFGIKSTIGDVTQFTGNPSDDKLVNSALKSTYGKVKDAMNKAAAAADPELGAQLLKANERYADFTSAQIALKNRIALNQSKNLISMPIKVGGVAGILTALATGGAAIPAVLAGAGAAALDKALASAAVKTRVAAWLGKESPEIIAGIIEKNPGIGPILKKAFSKEYTPIENALADLKTIPNKQGGFVNIGGGKVIKQIDEATKAEIWDTIKYLGSGQEIKGKEATLDRLLQRYNISADQSVSKIKARLTALLDKTKTK